MRKNNTPTERHQNHNPLNGRTRRHRFFRNFALPQLLGVASAFALCSGLVTGCAKSEDDGTIPGRGGRGGSSTGGSSTTGGTSNTGGSGTGGSGTGGSSTGGSSNTGGSSTTGGTSNTGGRSGTGGSSTGGSSTGGSGTGGTNGSDCGGIPQWVSGTDYKPGDLVSNLVTNLATRKKFKCKDHPQSGWCKTYDPGNGFAWMDAWDEQGVCSPGGTGGSSSGGTGSAGKAGAGNGGSASGGTNQGGSAGQSGAAGTDNTAGNAGYGG